jgi:tRNA1(Val) A37 N6-methylase TrmN6
MAFSAPSTTIQDDWAQPEKGYRFSEDSILLASLAFEAKEATRVGSAADLGAGCGVVGLEALVTGALSGIKALHLVEADANFLGYLQKNVKRAKNLINAPCKVEIHLKDWRDLNQGDFGGPLSYITSNPPYFTLQSGRSGVRGNSARRESRGGLAELIEAAFSLLKVNGIFTLSFPRCRTYELIKLIKRRFQAVSINYPSRAKSSLALITLQKADA